MVGVCRGERRRKWREVSDGEACTFVGVMICYYVGYDMLLMTTSGYLDCVLNKSSFLQLFHFISFFDMCKKIRLCCNFRPFSFLDKNGLNVLTTHAPILATPKFANVIISSRNFHALCRTCFIFYSKSFLAFI